MLFVINLFNNCVNKILDFIVSTVMHPACPCEGRGTATKKQKSHRLTKVSGGGVVEIKLYSIIVLTIFLILL